LVGGEEFIRKDFYQFSDFSWDRQEERPTPEKQDSEMIHYEKKKKGIGG